MVKTMNFVRILTVLLFLAVYFFSYAFMPVRVNLIPEGSFTIHKEQFFFWGVGLFCFMNVMSWALMKLGLETVEREKGENTAAWFAALPGILNISYCLIIGFLGVLNNPQHISPTNYSYLNFMIPVLITGWIAGFLYMWFAKKNLQHKAS